MKNRLPAALSQVEPKAEEQGLYAFWESRFLPLFSDPSVVSCIIGKLCARLIVTILKSDLTTTPIPKPIRERIFKNMVLVFVGFESRRPNKGKGSGSRIGGKGAMND